jgi:hypothetical protein
MLAMTIPAPPGAITRPSSSRTRAVPSRRHPHPLAQTELDSDRGPAFQTLIQRSPAGRVGTADEVTAARRSPAQPES